MRFLKVPSSGGANVVFSTVVVKGKLRIRFRSREKLKWVEKWSDDDKVAFYFLRFGRRN